LRRSDKKTTGDSIADDWDRQDRRFRKKVAIQQFMNHNAAIFSALARSGTEIDGALDGDVLKKPVTQAHALSREVAALVAGKDIGEVTAADAKPFRSAAADIIAEAYFRGREIDVKSAARNIAAAAALADDTWDHDLYKDDNVRPRTSVRMTAAAVAGGLSETVAVYDFRVGREEVLERLMRTVIETAVSSAIAMMPEDANEGELSNLTQTLARTMTGIMKSCYERKARTVVASLEHMSEGRKRDWPSRRLPKSRNPPRNRRRATISLPKNESLSHHPG
jgi:hypothetical protein